MIKDNPKAFGFNFPINGRHVGTTKVCGSTKIKMSASLQASKISGTAITLVGSLCPGRYLTFSCSVLMISVNLRPLMISSYTYILTSFSKWSNFFTFSPTILAIVDPLQLKFSVNYEIIYYTNSYQLPDPTRQIFFGPCSLQCSLLVWHEAMFFFDRPAPQLKFLL